MTLPPDDAPGGDHIADDDFEARLRRDLQLTGAAAAATGSWRDVADRSRRRDRTTRMVGGIGVLVMAVTAATTVALVPRSGDRVQLDSVAGQVTQAPTERVQPRPAAPEGPIPSLPGMAGRPEAQLLVSTGEDLQITDLDGVLLGPAAWQPTQGAGPVSEVVVHPDGSTVAVWHRDCLVEAGSVLDGDDRVLPHVVDGIPSEDGCSGPAVFSPDGTAVAWTSGAEGQGRLYTAAWTAGGVDPDTITAVGEEVIDLAATRVVGWDEGDLLLVRQRRDLVTELRALQVNRTEGGGAIAVGDFLVPVSDGGGGPVLAFSPVDGRTPLDASADQVLDAQYVYPGGDDSSGVIDELGIRPLDGSSGFSRGNLAAAGPIDPMAIWFDAWGSIQVFGTGDGEASWLGGDGSTNFGPFPIGAGVTAAAIVPGSERVVASEPGPTPPATDPAEEGAPEVVETEDGSAAGPVGAPATAWCGERLLVAVVTTGAGALQAVCGEGTVVPVDAGPYRHASLGRDTLLVHTVPTLETRPQVVAFDLVTGASEILADGTTPAVARDGTAAWVVSGSDGGRVVQISAAVGQEPVPTGPPLPDAGPITRLSWDRDGRWLFIGLAVPGGPLTVVALDTDDPTAGWQPLPPVEGDTIVAVAGETDTPDTAALLVRDTEGALTISGAALAAGDRTLPFPQPTGISPVTGVEDTYDGGFGQPLIEPVGPIRIGGEGWRRSDSIAWLVGDGVRLWLAGPPGDAVLISDDVATITVSPSVGS